MIKNKCTVSGREIIEEELKGMEMRENTYMWLCKTRDKKSRQCDAGGNVVDTNLLIICKIRGKRKCMHNIQE